MPNMSDDDEEVQEINTSINPEVIERIGTNRTD